MSEPTYPTLVALLKYNRGGTFVDVGAHFGLFSVHFVLAKAKVYAVEPYSLNIDELRNNTEGLGVIVVPMAMSNMNGTAELYHGGPSTLHSLDPDMAKKILPQHQEAERQPSEQVRIIRWGTFCSDYEIQSVDILKLDAKWVNVPVLEAVFEDGPLPRVICVEIRADDRDKISGMCTSMGYELKETIGLDAARGIHDAIFERAV